MPPELPVGILHLSANDYRWIDFTICWIACFFEAVPGLAEAISVHLQGLTEQQSRIFTVLL